MSMDKPDRTYHPANRLNSFQPQRTNNHLGPTQAALSPRPAANPYASQPEVNPLTPPRASQDLGDLASTAPSSPASGRAGAGSASPAPESPRWADAGLCATLDAIEEALGHMPYAVCGAAALAVYGKHAQPRHVSVMVPAHSKRNVLCWAAAAGLAADGADRNRFALGAGRGAVRVKYADEAAWRSLRAVVPPCTRARVLDLASCLDEIASAFLQTSSGTRDGGEEAGPRPARGLAETARRRAALAKDACWVLGRIGEGLGRAGGAEPGVAALSVKDLGPAAQRGFWAGLRELVPDAPARFARAGLPVDADGNLVRYQGYGANRRPIDLSDPKWAAPKSTSAAAATTAEAASDIGFTGVRADLLVGSKPVSSFGRSLVPRLNATGMREPSNPFDDDTSKAMTPTLSPSEDEERTGSRREARIDALDRALVAKGTENPAVPASNDNHPFKGLFRQDDD